MKRIAGMAVAVLFAACTASTPGATTTEPTPSTTAIVETVYPVTIEASNGPVTLATKPQAIVSLSPTATEMLFAVGAGGEVVAVDEFSYFPAEAPVTELSGFAPNVEAIAAYEPDLVVLADDIDGVVGSLTDLGIPTVQMSGLEVQTLDDVYAQIRALGMAVGHGIEAEELIVDMKASIEESLASVEPRETPLTYYHELDSTFYTVTSSTFIGHLYSLFGLENIADPADVDGASFGYPQLSEEYILEADPDFIFLTDCCGDTIQTISARPGWDDLSAIRASAVVVFDDDVSSRWGPRLVEFMRGIARAVSEKDPT
ncbi:MAG: ABC transporter substrate-binding protein [Acidimicrobiia bacterium]|nr:ABC transporter substrate-binding protein [Acidimicrobiia bacterium]